MSTPCPTPLTPGPWHVAVEDDGGAWICDRDNVSIGYMEHAQDAAFIVALVTYLQERRAQLGLHQPQEVPHE